MLTGPRAEIDTALDSNWSASLLVTESSWSGLPAFCIRMLPPHSEEPLAVVRREARDAARHGVTEQRWAEGPVNLMKQPQIPASPAQEQSGMMQKEPDIDWEAVILASLPAQVWKPGLVSLGQQLGTRTQKSTFSVHEGCVAIKTDYSPLAENSGPFLLQLPAICNLIHCRSPPTPCSPAPKKKPTLHSPGSDSCFPCC